MNAMQNLNHQDAIIVLSVESIVIVELLVGNVLKRVLNATGLV